MTISNTDTHRKQPANHLKKNMKRTEISTASTMASNSHLQFYIRPVLHILCQWPNWRVQPVWLLPKMQLYTKKKRGQRLWKWECKLGQSHSYCRTPSTVQCSRFDPSSTHFAELSHRSRICLNGCLPWSNLCSINCHWRTRDKNRRKSFLRHYWWWGCRSKYTGS